MKPQTLSNFARLLRREWRVLDLPAENRTIIVAVSGGADSTALLIALHELQRAKKLALRIVAAHFNHDLRGEESRKDAEFVKNLATEFDFEYEEAVSNLKSQISNTESSNFKSGFSNKDNLEQSARRARYDFLQKTAEKYSAVAVLTAHSLNDQAETFLLRLMRGSASDGLAGMKPTRELKSETADSESNIEQFKTQNSKLKILLIRPLLRWARREMTEQYCRDKAIEFRFDAMNDDPDFDRVRVRREVLPLLKSFNPQIIETLAQTAALLGEDAEELNQIAENLLKEAETADRKLAVSFFDFLSPSLRRRVVRLWLERRRGSLRRISFKHLRAIDNLIMKAEGGKFVELPGGAIVLKQKNRLVYRELSEDIS